MFILTKKNSDDDSVHTAMRDAGFIQLDEKTAAVDI
jgi:hypothetical protein